MSRFTPDDNPYVGIFESFGSERPVMSRPPRMIASPRLRQIVRIAHEQNPTEEEFADWLADYLEGYGALFARPVFDMDGNGPQCSFCRQFWPMCGHHHLSAECGADSEEENDHG